jgi:hypothetical protein
MLEGGGLKEPDLDGEGAAGQKSVSSLPRLRHELSGGRRLASVNAQRMDACPRAGARRRQHDATPLDLQNKHACGLHYNRDERMPTKLV